MSEKAASLIGQAFDCLDSKCEGAVSLQCLECAYNAEQHPHCLTRRKSPETIKSEFISAICRKANSEGKVTKEAFVDYYAELNFCVPNERATVSFF